MLEDDLIGGHEEDEDFLEVRTKDILVLHLPELKVSHYSKYILPT